MNTTMPTSAEFAAAAASMRAVMAAFGQTIMRACEVMGLMARTMTAEFVAGLIPHYNECHVRDMSCDCATRAKRALGTFDNAMRRHQRRARRMGLSEQTVLIGWKRAALVGNTQYVDDVAMSLRDTATEYRRTATNRRDVQAAFLYDRAADAAAKLRAALPPMRAL